MVYVLIAIYAASWVASAVLFLIMLGLCQIEYMAARS